MKMRNDDGEVVADVKSIPDYIAVKERDPDQEVRGNAFELQYERHGRWVGDRLPPWPSRTVEDQQWQWTRFPAADGEDGRTRAEAFMDYMAEHYDATNPRN